MKEVLEHGNNKYKSECFTCGCKFTYELEDLEETYVICPDCGHKVAHYPDDFVRNSKIEPKEG